MSPRILPAASPLAPDNLSVSVVGMDVHLDWDDVTQDTNLEPIALDHYLVYYLAGDPYGDHYVFGEDGSITSSGWVHAGAASSYGEGFYYVTALAAD
jgi:hypothetical protein